MRLLTRAEVESRNKGLKDQKPKHPNTQTPKYPITQTPEYPNTKHNTPNTIPYNFLFAAEDTGQPVMSIVRKWGIRDAYRITVTDERYDPRLLLAVATGLDFLQNR